MNGTNTNSTLPAAPKITAIRIVLSDRNDSTIIINHTTTSIWYTVSAIGTGILMFFAIIGSTYRLLKCLYKKGIHKKIMDCVNWKSKECDLEGIKCNNIIYEQPKENKAT